MLPLGAAVLMTQAAEITMGITMGTVARGMGTAIRVGSSF